MEIYDVNGNVNTNISEVLQKWRQEFEHLYTFSPEDGEFEYILAQKAELELRDFYFPNLNQEILESEVHKSIFTSKNQKAVGVDNLPNEVFRNHTSVSLLTKLFNFIFI